MKSINSYNKFFIFNKKINKIVSSMVYINYYYIARDKIKEPIFDYCTHHNVGVAICKEIDKL